MASRETDDWACVDGPEERDAVFLLKKVVAPLFYPLPLCLLVLIVGLALLWWTGRQRLGKWVVTVGVGLLLIVGQGAFSEMLIRPLETRIPTLRPESLHVGSGKAIKWVVVLGAGQTTDPTVPLTSQISDVALVRLVEGIRVYRALPGSLLVLSGGAVFDSRPEAVTMSRLAEQLGVDPDQIITETRSRDTVEEAVHLKPLIGADRFVLVTSASHMPRAMAIFHKRGMRPIPAPTDYYAMDNLAFYPASLFPGAGGIPVAQSAMHEYMGLAWAWLRGDI